MIRRPPRSTLFPYDALPIYSSECFAAIEPLEGCEGWDTIDEMRALMRGFKTQTFRHIRAYHHRPQGEVAAAWRGSFGKAETAYYFAYSPIFLLPPSPRAHFTRPLPPLCLFPGFSSSFPT